MAKSYLPYSAWAGLSLLLLVPCYWLSRIVSVDLGSHIYNAWLTLQVSGGQVQGIEIASQWNNVLFDWLLVGLLPLAGPDWAQRIAVSLGVLMFAGGSMMFIITTSRRVPWHILPGVAMLAYGFVFHLGLFNFYFSAGFCLGALALLWNFSMRRALWATPLIALGILSHPLPVIWLAAVMTFTTMARRVAVRNRHVLTVVMFGILLAAAGLLSRLVECKWKPVQVYLWSGADQSVVYGDAYVVWGLAWLVWWTILFGLLIFRLGWPRVLKSVLFHLIFLQAVMLIFVPTQIREVPGYPAPFAFFTERMSLLQGVLVCALLARAPLNGAVLVPSYLLGASYFYWLYGDDRLMLRFEDKVTAITASMQGFPRVLGGLCTPARRLNYAAHLVDRACVGKCYSYGNYEPSSGQFRLRAHPGNRYVVSEISRAYALERGEAKVTAEDLPLLRVEGILGGEVTLRELREGEEVAPPCPESR